MSVSLFKFKLRYLPSQHLLKKYMSFQCPENKNLYSTTFKVNACTWLCTLFLGGTITKAYKLLKKDNNEINKRLDELTKN